MGVTPWELVGGTKTLWYARHQAVRNSEIARGNRQRKQIEQQEQQTRKR
jgi:hypothetical protein